MGRRADVRALDRGRAAARRRGRRPARRRSRPRAARPACAPASPRPPSRARPACCARSRPAARGPEGHRPARRSWTTSAAQVDRLAAEELRVRRDAPDSVHQLRVAARRLRSALQAYRPLLDRRRTDPSPTHLRDLGRQLAPARDAEVLRERIDAGLAALRPELLLGPVQAEVDPALRPRRGGGAGRRAHRAGQRRARRAARRPRRAPGPPTARRDAPAVPREGAPPRGRTARRLHRAMTAAPRPRATTAGRACTPPARPASGCATPPRWRGPRPRRACEGAAEGARRAPGHGRRPAGAARAGRRVRRRERLQLRPAARRGPTPRAAAIEADAARSCGARARKDVGVTCHDRRVSDRPATRSPTCAASRSSWSARTSRPTGCARSAAARRPRPPRPRRARRAVRGGRADAARRASARSPPAASSSRCAGEEPAYLQRLEDEAPEPLDAAAEELRDGAARRLPQPHRRLRRRLAAATRWWRRRVGSATSTWWSPTTRRG